MQNLLKHQFSWTDLNGWRHLGQRGPHFSIASCKHILQKLRKSISEINLRVALTHTIRRDKSIQFSTNFLAWWDCSSKRLPMTTRCGGGFKTDIKTNLHEDGSLSMPINLKDIIHASLEISVND